MDKPLSFRPPRVIDQEIVYEGIYKVRRDSLELSRDSHYHYYTIVGREAAVMVIAETDDGMLVINREYRHPTGEILLSLPGGVLENGEHAVQGAERELMEETGFRGSHYEVMGEAYPLPGLYPQKISYVRARQAKQVSQPNLETAEYIHTELMTYEALLQAIAEGQAVDGILCTALTYYKLWLSRPNIPE